MAQAATSTNPGDTKVPTVLTDNQRTENLFSPALDRAGEVVQSNPEATTSKFADGHVARARMAFVPLPSPSVSWRNPNASQEVRVRIPPFVAAALIGHLSLALSTLRCHFPAGVMQMTDLSPSSLRWPTSRCMSPHSTGMRFGRQRRLHWTDVDRWPPGPLAFRLPGARMLQVIKEAGDEAIHATPAIRMSFAQSRLGPQTHGPGIVEMLAAPRPPTAIAIPYSPCSPHACLHQVSPVVARVKRCQPSFRPAMSTACRLGAEP